MGSVVPVRLVDAFFVVLAVIGNGTLMLHPWQPRFSVAWLASVLLLVSAVSLYWRRSRPEVVFGVAVIANTLHLAVMSGGDLPTDVSVFLASFTVAAYGRAAYRVWLPFVAVVPIAAAMTVTLADTSSPAPAVLGTVIAVIVVGVPWLIGDGVLARRRYAVAMEERAAHLEAERELHAAQAVLEERARIARELHDIVAHHVSVMGMQAGAARLALDLDPDAARGSLRAIEDSGREAIGEMRRMLTVLRTPGERPATSGADKDEPQPSLARLPALIGQFRAAGLPVELSEQRMRAGTAPPATLQLSAYRIVEQALTNTVDHAGAPSTSVRVRVDDLGVEIEVENQRGTATALRTDPGRGHGLIGMRERVSMLGGVLESGSLPDGGYRVFARLPAAAS